MCIRDSRYFGTVTEVMYDLDDKHGVTLLVQDAEPNFVKQQPAEWVGLTEDDANRLRRQGRCLIHASDIYMVENLLREKNSH
jgi:hypothetical protein